jgi:NAD(P)-dependent dehydrogenase (short-subunit alcohol dehydrogenase family)
MKTWFITGISRGLGLALAKAALRRGDMVIATVRSGTPDLAAPAGKLHVIRVDLADGTAAEAATKQAFALADRVDVIVNNAGYGLLGATEKATDAELAHIFAVDVFAPFRVIRTALPYLRAQGSGHIVNVTSVAGRAPAPGYSLYAAVKFALEGFSISIAQELAPLGIKVTAVSPGAFRTDFLAASSIRKSEADAAYAGNIGRITAAFDANNGKQIGDPERGAEAIITAVNADTPPLHLLLGSDALRRMREKLDQVIEEMDRWEDVTRSTDFPAAAA